jgi:hypothetical protein
VSTLKPSRKWSSSLSMRTMSRIASWISMEGGVYALF